MKIDLFLFTPILLLIAFGLFILNSIAPYLFPDYYWYVIIGLIIFLFLNMIDFEVVLVFSKYLYILSIVLLLITLVIGQVTRGTVRWIPIGPFTVQPSEIVRPLLLVYFAGQIAGQKLNLKRLFQILLLMALPLVLILIQPSLGVSALTAIGFLGLFLASEIDKKYILYLFLIGTILLPITYFLLAPYQKDRINAFLNPQLDPLGVGYNAIQSMISVGSGELFGRGLGRGVGTQLAFLPERSTDFIFASIAEELGFAGGFVLLSLTFILLWRMLSYSKRIINIPARLFIGGFFLTIFAQIFIHVGMNMGLMPITGVPYPLVSAGGSSLLATLISFGIVAGTVKR